GPLNLENVLRHRAAKFRKVFVRHDHVAGATISWHVTGAPQGLKRRVRHLRPRAQVESRALEENSIIRSTPSVASRVVHPFVITPNAHDCGTRPLADTDSVCAENPLLELLGLFLAAPLTAAARLTFDLTCDDPGLATVHDVARDWAHPSPNYRSGLPLFRGLLRELADALGGRL